MIPYWALFAYFALGTMLSDARPWRDGVRQTIPKMMLLGCVGMIVMIGMRYKVGGDWLAYTAMFSWSGYASFDEVMLRSEGGYMLLNWMTQQMGGDIWVVNSVCALITVSGIVALARLQPLPWVAVLVAVPYLVVVVAMGYTRQAAALGFVMLGLAGLIRNQSILRYAMWVVLAALFHKTAVIALPLVAFVVPQGRLVNFLLVSLASVGLYFAFLDDQLDDFMRNYVETRYSSSGALIRISMCVIPALIFAVFRKRLEFSELEDRLWRNFSLAAGATLIAYAISPSSTAVDRVALYLLPLQFVIFSRIPGSLANATLGKSAVTLYAGLVLFIWMTFAVHARYWLPYQFWFAAN